MKSINLTTSKHLLLQKQTLYKVQFSVYGIQVSSPEGHGLFQGELMAKYWKCIDDILTVFFRTTVQISNKLGTKQYVPQIILWWRKFRFIQLKGKDLIRGGDNSEIAKNTYDHFEILLQNHWSDFNQN